jgi:hypothetical protein
MVVINFVSVGSNNFVLLVTDEAMISLTCTGYISVARYIKLIASQGA